MRTSLAACLFALPALAQTGEIRLETVTSGLTNPVDIQSPRDGSGRLFIVQQTGQIRLWRNGQLSTFLDIASRTNRNNECGLLGLAFPPGFAAKRHFFVNYTDPQCRNSIVARYSLASDNTADPASERVVMRVAQPFSNHNGGQLQFGPDGYLYIGWGDGGSGGDPLGSGQDRRSMLGKMLRIDVETEPYRVPPDNPFVGDASTLPEIWALGLRNPWRYSFDRQTGDLWIADVGQNRAEEIDFQPAASRGGENYGWNVMEGFRCRTTGTCNSTGTVMPVHEYDRLRGDLSVTGGYVYRGAVASQLTGTYIYADYVSGRIWGLDRNFQNRLLLASGISISTFGEDEDGTLYLADHGGGRLMRIVPSALERTVISVVNGASFLPGLAPGAAASVFLRGVLTENGIVAASSIPLPRSLAGVSVLVNGREAPLYAVAKTQAGEQVNFQVPFETAAGTATVQVRSGSGTVELGQTTVRTAQPGVFQWGSEGLMVHAADNTLVTADQPLRTGEFAYFYATGLGATQNQPETGSASTGQARANTAITVTLGGRVCEVTYAGLAPGLVGVYQVNIRVPEGIASGAPHLVMTQGTQFSRPVPVWLRQ
jgi:uncharacterized protein (TIGR03437 family)